MKLKAFRVENFRSIVDSGWIKLSLDGVTVFVGQNESGKTSVLEALHFALSRRNPGVDDSRVDSPAPSVVLSIEISPDDFVADPDEPDFAATQAIVSYSSPQSQIVDLAITWLKNAAGEYQRRFDLKSAQFREYANSKSWVVLAPTVDADGDSIGAPVRSGDSEIEDLDAFCNEVAEVVWEALPLGVLFNEVNGRLPDRVEIDVSQKKLADKSPPAATNFLEIAELKVSELLSDDKRTRETKLLRASQRITADFNTFWSQTIGGAGKLEITCELDFNELTHPERPGAPYLAFWIKDGVTKFYPKQRSLGMRWFLSFYLQLRSAEKAGRRVIYLLDEPGANLHAKAQEDVLRLVDSLSKSGAMVAYTTHSPQLIEYSKLYRVHAVQRVEGSDDSPTIVIDAHRLGTASTDTLSPVLNAMGASLSGQQVIRKECNVLLEEMSGYYYLSSFMKLLGIDDEIHFIAATGVNKIEPLANMFIGWGLSFIVVMDDDSQGREAYKSIRKNIFGEDSSVADKRMYKMKGFSGVEDIFTLADFTRMFPDAPPVVGDESVTAYIKRNKLSKPVLAYQFALAVSESRITRDSLSEKTLQQVSSLAEEIRVRLNALH